MLDKIDKLISSLETELAELRSRKIALLQAQLAEVEAALAGNGPATPARGSAMTGKVRARRGASGWAAGLMSSGGAGRTAEGPSRKSSGGWVADLMSHRDKNSGPKKRGRQALAA